MTDTLVATNGRSMKFTPERLGQIRNLVERGLSREQIAETMGTTLGSLQVTCSRYNISLRRPRIAPPARKPPSTIKESKMVDPTPSVGATITLEISHDGRTKKITIPISTADFIALIMEAEVKGKRLSELIASKIKGAKNG
jgi:hypothetical protein